MVDFNVFYIFHDQDLSLKKMKCRKDKNHKKFHIRFLFKNIINKTQIMLSIIIGGLIHF